MENTSHYYIVPSQHVPAIERFSLKDEKLNAQLKLNVRYSVDGTLALIEGFVTPQIQLIINKYKGSFIYLGKNENGTVDKAVYDYLEQNSTVWCSPKSEESEV